MPKKNSLSKEKKLEGRYANYFKVGYNSFEFVFDFGQFHPENDQAELYTRIITAPIYAKNLFKVLKESIIQYEENIGKIQEE